MATSSARTDTADSPLTCCSSCRTVFQVSSELLSSVDTRVRCGECFSIFDALANLVDEPVYDKAVATSTLATTVAGTDEAAAEPSPERSLEQASLAGLSNDTSALDVTYSDFDLFSEEAELPEVAYFDQTRDTPDFDFDSVEFDEDETLSDTLFVNDVTVEARTGDNTPLDTGFAASASLPVAGDAGDAAAAPDGPPLRTDVAPARPALAFTYRDPDGEPDGESARPRPTSAAVQPDLPVVGAAGDADGEVAPESDAPLLFDPPTSVRGSFWLRAGMVLLFAALLASLYGYRQRDRLHEDRFTRPVYEVVCRVTGCQVPMREALGQLELVKRTMYSHPRIDDALVIDVAFRNNAPFAQRHPALVVRLSDPSGRVVARRAFAPDEYLPADRRAGAALDTLAANERLDVSLEVVDPGRNTSSFVVDFVRADASAD